MSTTQSTSSWISLITTLGFSLKVSFLLKNISQLGFTFPSLSTKSSGKPQKGNSPPSSQSSHLGYQGSFLFCRSLQGIPKLLWLVESWSWGIQPSLSLLFQVPYQVCIPFSSSLKLPNDYNTEVGPYCTFHPSIHNQPFSQTRSHSFQAHFLLPQVHR